MNWNIIVILQNKYLFSCLAWIVSSLILSININLACLHEIIKFICLIKYYIDKIEDCWVLS